jgi:hypothetical protein
MSQNGLPTERAHRDGGPITDADVAAVLRLPVRATRSRWAP